MDGKFKFISTIENIVNKKSSKSYGVPIKYHDCLKGH